MSYVMKNFADNVKYICYSRGISVSEFEHKHNLGKGFFGKILNGTIKNVSIEKAMAIAGVLGEPVGSLLVDDYSILVKEKDIRDAEQEIKALEEKIKKLKGDN